MKHLASALAVTGLFGAVFCQPVAAQISVMQHGGTVYGEIDKNGQFDNIPYSTIDVLTVPDNRRFRLTDLIFTNYSSDPCDVGVLNHTAEIRIQPSSTLQVALQSGITFLAGETITLFNTWRLPGHGVNCQPI